MIKNFLKRAAAGALTLAMCASLTGCYSEDKAWAARMGDDVLPVGGYIYYLTSAYNEAKPQVDSSTDVLKGQVEGESAQSWIENRAQEYMQSYYFVNQKFDELGLSLTDEDMETVKNSTNLMWNTYGYKTPMETLGCAEASFDQAYSLYSMKLDKLLMAMCGKGGEMETPEEELHTYYIDNYTYYQYFYLPMSTTDEEGNSTQRTDEEKEELKATLQEYVDKINSGESEFGVAEADFINATGTGEEVSHNEPAASLTSSMGTMFSEALADLDVGKAALVDATSGWYVMQKLDIEEDFEALKEDQDRYDNLLRGVKMTEFMDYTVEQGASLKFETNPKAIATVKVEKIAETMGKAGTSSAAENESSSSEED